MTRVVDPGLRDRAIERLGLPPGASNLDIALAKRRQDGAEAVLLRLAEAIGPAIESGDASIRSQVESLWPAIKAASGWKPAPERPICCQLRCEADAEFELRDGPAPDDYTHACRTHVGDLLAGSRATTITGLGQPRPPESPAHNRLMVKP